MVANALHTALVSGRRFALLKRFPRAVGTCGDSVGDPACFCFVSESDSGWAGLS